MQDIGYTFEIKRPATSNNLVYIYRLLYQNLMVNANQKSTLDIYIYIYKKKQSKHNTKDSHHITRETQTSYDITYICNPKNDPNALKKKKKHTLYHQYSS